MKLSQCAALVRGASLDKPDSLKTNGTDVSKIYRLHLFTCNIYFIFFLVQHGEYAVKTHHLEYAEGGILYMDDMLSDLVEDRDKVRTEEEEEQILSVFFFLILQFSFVPLSPEVWQLI